MLEDMYRAISNLEAWDSVKADPGEGGFMFREVPILLISREARKSFGTSSLTSQCR